MNSARKALDVLKELGLVNGGLPRAPGAGIVYTLLSSDEGPGHPLTKDSFLLGPSPFLMLSVHLWSRQRKDYFYYSESMSVYTLCKDFELLRKTRWLASFYQKALTALESAEKEIKK